MTRPVRIGVLGTAQIARQFISAVASSEHVEIAAVASRDGERARAYAAEYGIANAYGSYEALLADREIEAIYNPLPNSLHAEWSMKAARAGKHVLCEKPLATSGAEATLMFETARATGTVLLEAYPYLAQPQSARTLELVRSGAIGQLQLIRASFGVPFSDPTNIRLKPDLAGGALMDAGSYCVSFVCVVAGERPVAATAFARFGETGVDRTLVATLEFASGLVAQVAASFATAYHRHAQVAGERGVLETLFLNHPPIGGAPMVQIRRGATAAGEVETFTVPGGNGFLYEAESFAAVLRGHAEAWTGATPAQSVDIAFTLEAILASARSGSRVAIPEIT
jgi:predicted dehydrogenase